MNADGPIQLTPLDAHNRALIEQAHPAGWVNPTPSGRYNLVAIGGGTAGIIAALGAARLGGRAALVERHLLGGDCLNYGCVPSKALIASARAAHRLRQAGEYGIEGCDQARADFAKVMERLRRLRAGISRHDAARRFAEMGVDVYLGHARFTGADRIEVAGQALRFSRAVIATGSRPRVPDLPGLSEAGFLTNESVFSLIELPRRLAVIGAGPVGTELAQAFGRLGSEVHLVGSSALVLPREDPEASKRIGAQFRREGVVLHLGGRATSVRNGGDGKTVVLDDGVQVTVDEILVAVGREPNVDGLNLDAAGVRYTAAGVAVNDRLQTSNPRIYAAGDVCTGYRFTHAADAMARLCIQNALFLGRKRYSSLVIPRVTFTDPEVAHVGLTPREAREQCIAIESYRAEMDEVDRAQLEGQPAGFAVVHCRRGSGRIVGATIVAEHAGEMIGEITLSIANRLPLDALARTIHAYPTHVEVLKKIADRFSATRLTPRVSRLLERWLRWRR